MHRRSSSASATTIIGVDGNDHRLGIARKMGADVTLTVIKSGSESDQTVEINVTLAERPEKPFFHGGFGDVEGMLGERFDRFLGGSFLFQDEKANEIEVETVPGTIIAISDTEITIDVNGDGKLDCLFSNAERYSLHLFKDMKEGWSIKVIEGVRGQEGGIGPVIPAFVRADGTNNGVWFHSGALWVQNEDTAKLPDLVQKLTFAEMLGGAGVPPAIDENNKEAKTGNTPASRVEVEVADTAPYEIRIRGLIKESTFKKADLQTLTELRYVPGSNSFSLHDVLTNRADYPHDYQIIYHSNFGAPILENGARFLAPMAHIKMMAATQPFLSGAISKTVNLPTDATVDDVRQIYEEGFKLGLKAVALYRDGCKADQPLSTKRAAR